MRPISQLPAWKALIAHHEDIANQTLRYWFSEDQDRFNHFSLSMNEIFLDYSRHRLNTKTIALLCQLARDVSLSEKIAALFAGHPINITENRPALHVALRDKKLTSLCIDGKNIAPLIHHTRQKMHDLVDKIHAEQWLGATGKPISHIVNIGIGGSHLGPLMGTHALKDFAVKPLTFHFISTVDKAPLNALLQHIDPERSLFIISSKSFSTIETLTNARTILTWLKSKVGEKAILHHFIAITAAPHKAIAFGVPENHILPIWEWVGGRYSIWSAIGLPVMLMIGNQHFADFLAGAYEMDQHFCQANFEENMPVLLALCSIWYINFFGFHAEAIIPYADALRYLIPYLQQATMESNGKRMSVHHQPVDFKTSPVIFGEEGCNGQHTYHQLLHQGQHIIPADFILIGKSSDADDIHHDILLASALSQAEALMNGKTYEEAYEALLRTKVREEDAKQLAHHQTIPGNRPCNMLLMERLTPKNLGALIALYEHKIFVQGSIWGINSFDQFGVELGKQLLPAILQNVQGTSQEETTHPATQGFIHRLKKIRGQT